jgi:hypothetical protein
MTGTRLTLVIAIVVLGGLGTACRGDQGGDASPTLVIESPSLSTGATGSGLPSVPPTGSPGVTGNLSTGTASVTTTGAVNATATYGTLTSPGIWTPPPGAISLNWAGQGNQSLGITGASFTAQMPTAADRVLQFSVRGSDGVITFRSAAGECLVTISPALPTQMGGTFLCTTIPSDDGSISVNAQGTFSAE